MLIVLVRERETKFGCFDQTGVMVVQRLPETEYWL